MMLTLPQVRQSYRWLYVDVSNERFTAVVIFMIGSIFSRRYAARPLALPHAHSAVNVALYDEGECRLWALTEYGEAQLDGGELRIGGSSWKSDASSTSIVVRERTTPWGEPVTLNLQLQALAPQAPEVQLVKGLPHYWQAFAPHGQAKVHLASHDLTFEGRAYHDGNHGSEPLGVQLKRWRWTRTHHGESTRVLYEPESSAAIEVVSTAEQTTLKLAEPARIEEELSPWGLALPVRLDRLAQTPLAPPRRLESSPFYARLEATHSEAHALTEVADFARFRHPAIRWMADFRTRLQPPAAAPQRDHEMTP